MLYCILSKPHIYWDIGSFITIYGSSWYQQFALKLYNNECVCVHNSVCMEMEFTGAWKYIWNPGYQLFSYSTRPHESIWLVTMLRANKWIIVMWHPSVGTWHRLAVTWYIMNVTWYRVNITWYRVNITWYSNLVSSWLIVIFNTTIDLFYSYPYVYVNCVILYKYVCTLYTV